MLGSSATTSTSAPFTPVSAELMNGSAATFRPTCFMAASARTPEKEAPMATSQATFSLVDH